MERLPQNTEPQRRSLAQEGISRPLDVMPLQMFRRQFLRTETIPDQEFILLDHNQQPVMYEGSSVRIRAYKEGDTIFFNIADIEEVPYINFIRAIEEIAPDAEFIQPIEGVKEGLSEEELERRRYRNELAQQIQTVKTIDEVHQQINDFVHKHGRENLPDDVLGDIFVAVHIRARNEAENIAEEMYTRWNISPNSDAVSTIIDHVAHTAQQAVEMAKYFEAKWNVPISQEIIVSCIHHADPQSIMDVLREFFPSGSNVSSGILFSAAARFKSIVGIRKLIADIRTEFKTTVSVGLLSAMMTKVETPEEGYAAIEEEYETAKENPAQVFANLFNKVGEGKISSVESMSKWFKRKFSNFVFSEGMQLHIGFRLRASSKHWNPIARLHDLERIANRPASASLYKLFLLKTLRLARLPEKQLLHAEELLVALEQEGYTPETLAEENTPLRFAIIRYFLAKKDFQRAIVILTPILQKTDVHRSERQYTLALMGKYLPKSHPLLQAAGTANEIEEAVQRYEQGSIKLSPIPSERYTINPIYEGVHTTPINRQAVRDTIFPRSEGD